MADTTQPASAASPPEDAVRSFSLAIASGDVAKVKALIAPLNADERVLHSGLASVCAAVGTVDQAITQAFGPGDAARWGTASDDAAAATVKPGSAQANRVTVQFVDRAKTSVALPLVRQGGAWWLTFDAVIALMRSRNVDVTPPTDEPMRRLVEMAEALKVVAADVRAGRLADAAAASEAAKQALADAARGKEAQ